MSLTAIKVLPASVAADHERLAPFQREAEVLASLNHPNIAAIYGIEESAGVTALVMELVEGDDLSALIDRVGDADGDIHAYSFRDQSMRPYLAGPFNQQSGAFSPDGRLVAFASDETGSSEIYIASFPDAGERLRVSAAGGSQAVWRRDGRELFFISPRRELMAVQVERKGTGPNGVTIGVPRALFRVDIKDHTAPQFDTITGERFLVNRDVDSGAGRPLTLVLQPFTPSGR